jgi:hypothetical protein
MAITSARSDISASASTVTLFPALSTRLGARLVNESSATLYLLEGAGATPTNYSEIVSPGASWTLDVQRGVYPGIITGVWSSATGTARCTERRSV